MTGHDRRFSLLLSTCAAASGAVLCRYLSGTLLLLLASMPLAVAAQGYSFGVLPYLAAKTLADVYGPATLDIGRQLGKPVTLKTSGSYERYREKLKKQYYDVAIIQPFDYPLVVEELGYIPLVQLKVDLHAVVIVKEGAPYQTLADLKGGRIAMSSRHSATSWQGVWALKEAGLLENGDVSVDFFRNHDACLHALQIDIADACITGPPPYKDYVSRTHARMRILMTTEAIPHILVVAHPRVRAADREAIIRIMSGWEHTEDGRRILQGMRFPGWKPAEPRQYAVMRQYLEMEQQSSPTAFHEGLVYGSFPYFAPRVMAEQVAPMVQAFSDALGRQVHFRTTPSFERFRENLGQGQYDIVLVRPYDYAVAVAGGYLPVARMARDLRANFYVRTDSHYRKLADLEGQVVALPPSTAVMNILGQAHLKRAGLTYIPAVRPGHDSCMEQMWSGKAAACVTADITTHAFGYQVGEQIRILDSTEAVPNILFMVHKRQSQAVRQRLTDLVLGWNDSEAGLQIMKASGLGPFSRVDVADYEALDHE